MQPQVDTAATRRMFDRRLFGAAAIIFPAIVLVGFARSYYLRGLFEVPPIPTAVVHLHGVLMSLWVLLFVVQVRLIATNRVALHQRLGYTSIALATAVVLAGVPTALHMGRFGGAALPPGIPSQLFMIVPLLDLVVFVVLFAWAVARRKRPAEHKRLMLLTAVNFLPPALARVPVPGLLALGPAWFFGFPTLLMVIALTLDWRRNGRVNPTFLAGIVFVVAMMLARLALMNTPAWQRLSAWLITFA